MTKAEKDILVGTITCESGDSVCDTPIDGVADADENLLAQIPLDHTVGERGDIPASCKSLLDILLLDRSNSYYRHEVANIRWLTDDYVEHRPTDQILPADITGVNLGTIQPRVAKDKATRKARTKGKAEVFTPLNIVKDMNDAVDEAFDADSNESDDAWQRYVLSRRLEITCGEAPFIVSRYDPTTGETISIGDRVGFLDRKLAVVSEHCHDGGYDGDWFQWALRAYQSSYGYEWQGDSLLLARENLLYTFVDYYNEAFPSGGMCLSDLSSEHIKMLTAIAAVISWNIFQMDGLKYVLPMTCKTGTLSVAQTPLEKALGIRPKKVKSHCSGCGSGGPFKHNGRYALVRDWQAVNKAGKPMRKLERFVDGLRRHAGQGIPAVNA